MDNTTMFLLMDLLVLGAGVYGIMEWYKMKQSGSLRDCKLILPANTTVADCKDPEGFYVYIMPRLIAFSILTLLGGAVSAVNDYWGLFGNIGTLITSAVYLAIIVVYCVIIRRAYNRFFR